MMTSPRAHDIELLLVTPGQGGAVSREVVRLHAPGAGRGLHALAAALFAHTRVLAEQEAAGPVLPVAVLRRDQARQPEQGHHEA